MTEAEILEFLALWFKAHKNKSMPAAERARWNILKDRMLKWLEA